MNLVLRAQVKVDNLGELNRPAVSETSRLQAASEREGGTNHKSHSTEHRVSVPGQDVRRDRHGRPLLEERLGEVRTKSMDRVCGRAVCGIVQREFLNSLRDRLGQVRHGSCQAPTEAPGLCRVVVVRAVLE